jgi:hypothetical protein
MSNEPNNRELSAPELLENAARLVERAMAKLDTKAGPCRTCGTEYYRSHKQFIAHRSLSATPERLRAAADRLREIDGIGSESRYRQIVLADR